MPEHIGRSLLFGSIVGIAATLAVGAGVALGAAHAHWLLPTFVIVLTFAVLLHQVKLSLLGTVDNRSKTIRKKLDRLDRMMGDVHGMVRLTPYMTKLPMPFGGGWALTGDSAAIIAREIKLRKPHTVVELGSGVSTLIIGQVLAENGHGRLISIDHDQMWAERTRVNVKALGLESIVTVLHQGLKPVSIEGDKYNWYDLSDPLISTLSTIDALVIDGPPHHKGSSVGSRYPALVLLEKLLTEESLVFVDDAARETEQRMVEKWLKRHPESGVERFDTVDGLAVISFKRGRGRENGDPAASGKQ